MTSRAFAFILSGSLLAVVGAYLGACSSDSNKSGQDASAGTGGTIGTSDAGGTGGSAGTGGAGTGGGSGVDGSIASDTSKPADSAVPGDTSGGSSLSFFISSRTGDGNLGGLDGADKICQMLADKVGAGGKTWHAYLSTSNPKVDAKTRIGTGPWYNVKGVKIADNVDGLHATTGTMGDTPGNTINATNGLTESGGTVPNNEHDILTGSNIDGTLFDGQTCMDWTGKATGHVGHFNRMGTSTGTPNSWNSAHENGGCTADTIKAKGGFGRFYCFAIN